MAFTSFSCLLALASIFNALLDNSGVGRHPWIVLSLRKKAFCHWPLSIMLAASLFIYFFVDTLHQVEEVLLYCHYSEITFLKLWMGVEFCQLLFLQHWFNYVIFFVSSSLVCNMADYTEFLKLMGCSGDGGGCCFLLFSCSVMSNFCDPMD